MQRHLVRFGYLAVALGLSFVPSTPTLADQATFLDALPQTPSLTASTFAANGDQNPYGVAIVRGGFEESSLLQHGDILVSDFNDAANLQGTGRSIVAIDPRTRKTSTFFTAPDELGTVGLTTALVALSSGIVIVGNAPRFDNGKDPPTVSNGSLIFLDGNANILLNLVDNTLLAGPWDMTADESDPDDPILYVSNVLSGTVTRVELRVSTDADGPFPDIESLTVVASGFAHRTDPAALVIGPTGVLLSHDGNDIYVADTGNNRVQLVEGVRDASRSRGAGETIVSKPPLNGPLGLAWTPRGTIVLSNGDAVITTAPPPPLNQVIEFDPENGAIVAQRQLDKTGVAGALFGIVIGKVLGETSLLYVDDNSTTLNVLPRR
jgi:hypothetical protein